jgi:hypothetical protein
VLASGAPSRFNAAFSEALTRSQITAALADPFVRQHERGLFK